VIRVGLVQTRPERARREANLDEVWGITRGLGVDLLVLPELFDTGYLFESQEEVLSLATEVPGGETCSFLVDLAARVGCRVAAGLAEREGARAFNSAVLVGPEGVIGLYRKVHLFHFEKEVFTPGDRGFPVFDAGGVKVGMMICYDWRFPEAARTLALKGAQVLAHPANLVHPYCQEAMVTRCLENRVFSITANRTGRDEVGGRSVSFTGRSRIVGPGGEVLAQAPAEGAAVLVVEIDPSRADDKRITPANDLFADRRPEMYF